MGTGEDSGGLPTPTAGLVVGGCRLHSLLGRGGMGTVYRATQLALGRQVAVKLVSAEGADAAFVARFQREVRTAAALEHPHAIPIYAAGEEDGLLYLVMRLVDGPDLGALLAAEGPLAPDRAVGLLEQVAGALDAAHAAGLVHRDVKPANILVERRAEGERAYLSDFGLMRRVSGATAITRVDEWVGSIHYVAPEQLSGQPVDLRADVYSLAGVLYTALTGHRPFPGRTPTEIARAHLESPPPRIDGGPTAARLNAVIAQGMAKRPADRYPSAGALAAAARAALAPGRGATRSRRRRPARGLLAALAGVAVLALAGGLALALGSRGRHEPRGSGTVSTHSTETVPASPPGSQAVLTLATFSVRYPAGWQVTQQERQNPGFLRTAMISPDHTESISIDRTPGATLAPEAAGLGVQQQTIAQTPSYEAVASYSTTLAGRPAFVWKFLVTDETDGAFIDIFRNAGGNGFAVLGQGPTEQAITPVALAVAASLEAR